MFNPANSKSEIIGIINSALTILDKYPNNEDDNGNYSFTATVNPFIYIFEILKNLVGYDKTINIIAWCLCWLPPILEVPVKAVLIAGLKNIFSCDINPLITRKLLREGIVIDLQTIDIVNMLRFSPLYTDRKPTIINKPTEKFIDKIAKNGKVNPGKYLYFGCDDMECADEVKYSKDFNAFLWYVKNHPNQREVWHSSYTDRNKIKGLKSEDRKQVRTDGILTLEYVDSSTNLTDAEGNPMNVQVPFNNCLHVFIGNAKEIENQKEIRKKIEQELNNESLKLKKLDEFYKTIYSLHEKYNLEFSQLKEKDYLNAEEINLSNNIQNSIFFINSIINSEDNTNDLKKYSQIPFLPSWVSNVEDFESKEKCKFFDNPKTQNPDYITINQVPYSKLNILPTTTALPIITRRSNNIIINFPAGDKVTIPEEIFFLSRKRTLNNILNLESKFYIDKLSNQYRNVEKNFYFNRPLLFFNLDYLSTIQIFNRETLVAEIIDALTGFLSMDVNFDIKQLVVNKEIEKMVNNVIEKDETTVSDCFFTFSNEEFDNMIKESEYERLGVYTNDLGFSNGKKIDAQTIARMIDKANDASTKNEDVTYIETLLNEVGDYIATTTNSDSKTDYNINVKFNFIEKFWQKLIEKIIWNILTPKIYMIIAINMNLMGISHTNDMINFILENKKVLVSLIRNVTDEVINQLIRILLSYMGDLIKRISFEFSMEQVLYYKTLLEKCFECINLKGSTVGYNLNDVGADIYNNPNEEPINKEC